MLVLVLIVLSSLIILSVGLAYRTRIEMRLAQSNAQRTQAYYLALGGIERIKALLSQEELSPSTIARICQFTGTAKEEGLFEQLKGFDLNEGKLLTYSLRDEKGYLNLNNSDPASWANIDYISEECCSVILDWIDEDNDAGPGGAETDFYERLELSYSFKILSPNIIMAVSEVSDTINKPVPIANISCRKSLSIMCPIVLHRDRILMHHILHVGPILN